MRIVEYAFVLLYLSIYIIYLPRLIIKQDIKSLKLLILEIVLQNIVSIMVVDVFGQTIAQIVILYKEIVMYASVFLFIIFKRKMKFKKYMVPVLVMMVICIPYFCIGQASLFTRLICFRQIMTPFILILYGSTFTCDKEEIKNILKFIVNLGVSQSIFGLLERFVLGDQFWLALNISKYMDAKGFSAWVFNTVIGQ